MNLQRVLIAFMMAAALAAGVTFLLFRRIRNSAQQGKTVRVVAAANNLSAGMTLGEKDVTLIDWHGDMPPTGSFLKAADVIGRPLIYPVAAQEPILPSHLGAEGSGVGLSAKIPTGMRATAVRSNEIVGVAGFLYPGSRVDVLATYTLSGANASPLTQTVLQNVEVLTAGQTIEPDPQGKPEAVNVVTLLVSPEDSQKLQLASSQGTIQFVLRSGVDTNYVEVHPTKMNQLVASEIVPALPVGKAKNLVKAPAPKPGYVLEIIQGTQRSVQKF
jgi:pilus assembly protein CpaB